MKASKVPLTKPLLRAVGLECLGKIETDELWHLEGTADFLFKDNMLIYRGIHMKYLDEVITLLCLLEKTKENKILCGNRVKS